MSGPGKDRLVPLPKHLNMRIRAALILACTLALAACGSSSQSSSGVASRQTTTSPATAQASTPTSSTTTSTVVTQTGSSTAPATTTPTAGPKACTAADLTVSYLGGQGAAGHGLLGFALRNSSGSVCHTYGYPGVLFFDRAGNPLPTDSKRSTTDYFGSSPEKELVVEPGQSVSFRLDVTHGSASPAGCTTAYGLQVIPPDDTATLHVTIGNGGAYECRTATVSPLQSGNSAFR
jgi:uncharacterized protein DUF4232